MNKYRSPRDNNYNGERRGGRGGSYRENRDYREQRGTRSYAEQEDEPQNDIANVPEIQSFEEMGLSDDVLRCIYAYGFEYPSYIQSVAIKPIVDGRELIAQSQSGTGKTGTFVIGCLHKIEPLKLYPQAIIMTNTRELALQIDKVVRDFGDHMKLNTAVCVGKTDIADNIAAVRKAHIIIGTPGRALDIIKRKVFDPERVKIFVMDEADELLRKDFKDQMREIINYLSKETQICVFSATLPRDVLDTCNCFLKDPLRLLLRREDLTLDLIAQYYIDVQQDDYKLTVLEDLYNKFSINQCIIYVNSRMRAEDLKQQLNDNKHTVEMIHSEIDAIARSNIMKRFRNSDFRVLISTDLLARGIDIQQVSFVINYDIPDSVENYLHRIGRSGRFGKRGVAINFVTKHDLRQMRFIEDHYHHRIQEMPDPVEVVAYLTSG